MVNLKHNYIRSFFLTIVASLSYLGMPAQVVDSVLVVPGGTIRIDDYTYADRDDFCKVVFESPVSLREIGDYAWMGCRNLREISLPSTVTKIGTGAFMECESLRRVSMPGVRKLPKECFAWCRSLEVYDESDLLNDIESRAFGYCESLRSIKLGNKLTHIGSNAFSFCVSLTEMYFPDSILELESYVLSECRSLRQVRLPGNRKMLGEMLLSGCREVEVVEEPSTLPPTFDCNSPLWEDNEDYMYGRALLRVPDPSKYRSASEWSRFTKIEPIKGDQKR